MCGIFGALNFSSNPALAGSYQNLLEHRGPDHFSTYTNSSGMYMAHNRLSIIDLDDEANQPMHGNNGLVIVFNGEIYNYQALKACELSSYQFKTKSDTEVILALYEKFGEKCVDYLRGMFAFAIWDERNRRLFCARDRFGIKPFYYLHTQGFFAFASEMKALLPLQKQIATDNTALSEYLTFQYTLDAKTLFKDIMQLMPGYWLSMQNGKLKIQKYWDINYTIDRDHSEEFFAAKLQQLLEESVRYHQVSDVPIGSYLSGGLDSALITSLAVAQNPKFYGSFHGRFLEYPGYDESSYAQQAANDLAKPLYIADITANDFVNNIQKIIYHLDVPVAGPGSFAQFMVSKLASQHVKVVLGGQGGDEIFGGYARYLIAYFDQYVKAIIDGTSAQGDFVAGLDEILPNLVSLRKYKPLMMEFWRDGLFTTLDERYFRLIDRSVDTIDEINWDFFDITSVKDRFKTIFNGNGIAEECMFEKMLHFDFKCLLPALLHVEDRMSMAHGLESRVPFLDHELIEFVATIPAKIKFPSGKMKALLKEVFKEKISKGIYTRSDKMGFPVPLNEWFNGPLREFVQDIFASQIAKTREFYNPKNVLANLRQSGQYSRKIWGLLSLELWYREFHDKQYTAQRAMAVTQRAII